MEINNEAIMASAGTGKTYNLAMRYLRLLQEGAAPESIVALTFSNKAAGEILDKIITVLLELIEREDKRKDAVESKFILPGSTTENFQEILHKLLACRKRLQISTIDSFFMQILQAFPMECGIADNISMIDEDDDRPRLQALLKLFAGADENKRRNLIEHLKDISFGSDEKSMNKLMKDFLHYTYPVYLNNPDSRLWGNTDAIWKEYDHQAQILSRKELEEIKNALSEHLDRNGIKDEGLQSKFTTLADTAKEYKHVRKFDDDALKYFFAPFKNNPGSLYDDEAEIEIKYRKMRTLDQELSTVVRKLIRHLLTLEFDYVITKTRALYSIFADFDQTYAATARNAGLLTFNDVACLIRGNTSSADFNVNLQTLEERIDAKTDHYMLDEFQDTSNPQWEILKNLADEAIRNYNGDRDRSFFFVGDIKQSIYQWRQGNPKLFMKICMEYEFNEKGRNGNLLSSLEKSYRSSIPVIETVNHVFQTQNFPAADEKGTLRFAVARMLFNAHSSAKSAAEQHGCAVMFEMKQKSEDFSAKALAIADLIKELNPFNRPKPLSVGILVRTNKTGRELADILVGEGLNVTVDGKLDPAQSLAFSAYRQLLRLAAHPEDKMAQGFLKMLTFGKEKVTLQTAEEVRHTIAQQGYHAFTRSFMQKFDCMSVFDRSRMEVVENAALRADQTGNLTIDEFLTELDLLKGSGSSSRNTVQIMTIHKSKGLDFNIVILPETSGGNIIKRKHSDKVAVRKDKDGIETQWISFLPKSTFIPLLPEMQSYADDADNDACYENCCNLYVAMTRARNALYIFNDPPPEKSSSAVQYTDLLRSALKDKSDPESMIQAKERIGNSKYISDISYAYGDLQWYQKEQKKEEKAPAPSQTAAKEENDFRINLHKNSVINKIIPAKQPCRDDKPSDTHEIEPEHLFQKRTAIDLGTSLHDILANFEFYTNMEDVRNFLQNQCTAPEEVRLLTSFFQSPEIQNIMREPDGKYKLWREKRFLTSTGNRIVHGCFDRVLIHCAEDGSPVSAEILDYKSDRDATPEVLKERHARQLESYREDLAKLIGLDTGKIRCTLLSIRDGFAVSF